MSPVYCLSYFYLFVVLSLFILLRLSSLSFILILISSFRRTLSAKFLKEHKVASSIKTLLSWQRKGNWTGMAFYNGRQFRLNQTHHIRDIKRYWSSQFSNFWSFCPNLFAFYTLLLSLLSFGRCAARDTSDKMHRWQFHKKALLGFPDIWIVLLLLFCTTINFWPVFGFIVKCVEIQLI